MSTSSKSAPNLWPCSTADQEFSGMSPSIPRWDSIRVRPVLDLRSSSGILLPNSAQMRVLERVGVFQTVAEDAVEAGVPEKDRTGKHEPGNGKQVSQNKDH